MKVYIYVLHKIHPNALSGVPTEGDISSVHSTKEIRPTKALDSFVPVLVDINIPCGQGEVTIPYIMDFDTNNFQCVKCPFNDVVSCDAIKYTRPKWTSGGIDLPPKRKYTCGSRIPLDTFLSTDSKTLVKKAIKTTSEKDEVFIRADKNEQLKSIIEEKA